VARAADVAFEKYACIAEITFAQPRDAREALPHGGFVLADAHADAAAAGGGLEDDRETDLPRGARGFLLVREEAGSGASGTPCPAASARALCFNPKVRMFSGVGPMNTIPAAAHASANSVFSARKPYPGWIAPAPVSFAALRIAAMSR